MSGHVYTRRTACDRCRELKLRCPRLEEDGSQTSCTRCDRAGSLCVTGRSRPLGRPRVIAPVSASSAPAPVPAPTSASDERRKRPRESPSFVARHPVDRSPARTLMEDYPSFLNAVPNAVTSMLDLPGPGDRPPRGPCEQPEQSFDLQFGDDDGLLSSLRHQFSPRSISGNRTGPIDFATGSFDIGPNAGSGASVLGEMSAFDRLPSQPTDVVSQVPIISLSRLSESVNRQIACLSTFTWGGPNQLEFCVAKVNETEDNPVSQALHVTADYNKALEQLLAQPQSSSIAANLYKSSNTDSAISMPTPDPSSSPEGHTCTTPVLLLVLSIYLQLLVLHDAILDRVCQALRELQDPTKFFQNAPDLTISNVIPAMKGHLYLKILVQVIEHHIDHAERLIGLPAEYRLSGQPAASGMLSGNAAAMSLLQVAMTQLDCTPKRSGKSIVASLKSNLKGLQRLVRS